MDLTKFEIPVFEWKSDAGGYKGIVVDGKDPRANDPLVRVADFGIAAESYYARTDGRNAPYNVEIHGSIKEVWCRRLVAEKMVRVNARLRPHGAELFVWDAYRSIETQMGLWSFFLEQARRDLPGSQEDELYRHVLKYVSDPRRFSRTDASTWPTHTTGGAIDLTLRSRDTNELLDMGAGFDEMGDVCHSDAFERELRAGKQPSPPLHNRRLLHWAMTEEGFVNYPFEYWHFDWGTQMYAHNLALAKGVSPSAAWYGYTDLETHA